MDIQTTIHIDGLLLIDGIDIQLVDEIENTITAAYQPVLQNIRIGEHLGYNYEGYELNFVVTDIYWNANKDAQVFGVPQKNGLSKMILADYTDGFDYNK